MADPVEQETPPATPPTPPPADPVDPPIDPAVKRLKDDLYKQKKEKQDLADEVKRLREEKLKANQQWEELAKQREKEAQEERDARQKLEKGLTEHHKSMALKTAAAAAGINPASLPDLDLLDFPEMDVETTSNGKIIVTGAQAAIARLRTQRAHWFEKKPASVNPHSPETTTGTPTTMTVAKAIELEAVMKKNPSPENKAAYLSAVKELAKK